MTYDNKRTVSWHEDGVRVRIGPRAVVMSPGVAVDFALAIMQVANEHMALNALVDRLNDEKKSIV